MGSLELASEPHFRFSRQGESISLALAKQHPQHPYDAVVKSLSPIGIDPCIIDTLVDLACFVQTVKVAYEKQGAMKFNVEAVFEDISEIQYGLLASPSPICNLEISAAPRGPAALVLETPDGSHSTGSSEWSAGATRPSDGGSDVTTMMSDAIRLTALLYMFLLGIGTQDSGLSSDSSGLLCLLLGKMRVLSKSLQAGTSVHVDNPSQLSSREIRGALIWICLGAEHVQSSLDMGATLPVDNAVIGDLLAQVIGKSLTSIALITDDDLGLCQVFDFALLTTMERWNARERMLTILGDWKAKSRF